MGQDPRASVVDSTGEHHQLRGLFVADGSLFPTSLGGPPQISIYAFALHLAPHAIARARGSGPS
jgi:choline dehydrogenase-like flavoprotein